MMTWLVSLMPIAKRDKPDAARLRQLEDERKKKTAAIRRELECLLQKVTQDKEPPK